MKLFHWLSLFLSLSLTPTVSSSLPHPIFSNPTQLPSLTFLSAQSASADASCSSSSATPIDADVAFLAYWEIIVVSWYAIADVKKRSSSSSNFDHSSLLKRDGLECTSAEECLSFKGVPFCYDKTYAFFPLSVFFYF